MAFDLQQLAQRITDAARRAEGLEVTLSNFDLILSRGGRGANRCEAVPFAGLFLSDRDLLGEALDRLEAAGREASSPT